jgi:hypothetical protein
MNGEGFLSGLLSTLLIIAGVAIVLAAILFAVIHRRLRRLQLPPEAGPVQTLRAVPLSLVVALDLLDLGLDFLSAPISWVILSRYGLQSLRQVAFIEALIPGTQFIPTMTLAWFFARVGGSALPGARQPGDQVIDHDPSAASSQRRTL